MTQNTPPPFAPSDIEESELETMLQEIIDARSGLSAIHHLLDGTQTMDEIRSRFIQWQASQAGASNNTASN